MAAVTGSGMPPRGTQAPAMMLAAVGVIAAVLRGTAWPWLPRLVPVVPIVLALGLLLVGQVRRVRWHLARRRR